MSRKIRFEEQSNHDRWVVSYADFVTLLFAFFVVMYSISSVNEDKYRVLSNAMLSAFNDVPLDMRVQQGGALVDKPLFGKTTLIELPQNTVVVPLRAQPEEKAADPAAPPKPQEKLSQQLDAAEQEVLALSQQVEKRMQPTIENELINLKRNKFWLEVEIKSSLLFESGSSALIPSSVPLLLDLADMFVDLPNRIHVEGFTDDQPIRTPVFPSNWELSAARAAAVVRLFERHGIDPGRMASIGYGANQPLTTNDTQESRAINRRVVVVVLAALGDDGNERLREFELLKERAIAQAGG
ncbi:MAG: flagellar motor protein MotD [Halioglobus sp.]